jgi:hypothetical protein
VLVIPNQLAGIGIDGEGAVRVQAVRFDSRPHGFRQQSCVIGLRDAEEGEIESRVVTSCERLNLAFGSSARLESRYY